MLVLKTDMEHRHSQLGFTLPEMLITLAILSTFLLLATPLNMNRLHEEQEKQFLNTLQSDFLYAQIAAAENPSQRVRISFMKEKSRYTLFNGQKKLVERNIPKNWIIQTHNIIFKRSGVVQQPASFMIKTPKRKFEVIFPFGKGRERIAEVERIHTN